VHGPQASLARRPGVVHRSHCRHVTASTVGTIRLVLMSTLARPSAIVGLRGLLKPGELRSRFAVPLEIDRTDD